MRLGRRGLVLWSGLDSWRAEVANLEVSGDRLVATGTQIGADPIAYRLDYSLDTGPAFNTQVLIVEASGEGWGRQLRLVHHADGGWTCATIERVMRRSLLRVVMSRRCAEHSTAISPALRSPTSCRFAATTYTSDRVKSTSSWRGSPSQTSACAPPSNATSMSAGTGTKPSCDTWDAIVTSSATLVFDRDGVVDLYPDLARRVATL